MRTVTALCALSLAAACSGDAAPRRSVPAAEAADLLVDRNWLDTWPKDKDDHLRVYRFVPSMGGGVFQDRTVFKGTFELFKFKTHGHGLELRFPHDGSRARARYQIERVDGPRPFDLKLTITPDPRGPGTYWGMTADHGQDLDALLQDRP